MGRLVSNTLQHPLHGLFVAPSPPVVTDLPQMLQIPNHALEGLVLEVEEGEPAARLLEMSVLHPTAFLIVGADPSAGDKLGVGLVATRVIEESNAPVLVVRPGVTPRLRRILLPLDGTPSTASAIEPATDLARAAGASLDIVLVGEARQPSAPSEHGTMSVPQYVDQPHHEWPAFSGEFVERFVHTLGHCSSDVPRRFFLGSGDPDEEILRYASLLDSDLAVLVWHGLASVRHGAIFQSVVRRAPCPLLILRSH
jgi:nucleotide-binding universal stress UspA family protein